MNIGLIARVRLVGHPPHLRSNKWWAQRPLAAACTEIVARMPEREDRYRAPLWDELFPAEQARIVRLLVERVDLAPDGMRVRLRAEGLQTLVEELRSREAKAA